MIVNCPKCGNWIFIAKRRRGYFQTVGKRFFNPTDDWHCDKCESRLTPVAPDRAGASTGEDESSTRAAGEHDG